MIKVTFRHGSGVYWAVCGSLALAAGSGYLLDSVMEDSLAGGPLPWIRTPGEWKIISMEEV